MRKLRALAAVLLSAGLLVAVPAGNAAAAGADTVVVPADGTPASTTFATAPGGTYRVTVTGVYSYNGRQNLADCGWWNPETAGDAWFPAGYLWLDGSAAPCSAQPYTTTHTYTWLEAGTGAPFTFQVSDVLPWDNVGALAVEVVELTGSVEVDCRGTRLARDSEIDGDVVHAVLRVSTSGVSTSVEGWCRFVGPNGTAATVYAYGTSPEAVGTDVLILPTASYSVCAAAYAFFIDGSLLVTGETCRPL